WHVHHALLGLLDPLADGLGNLLRLAEPEADTARAVADHDERAEAEAPPALHDLRHAVDVNDLLLQLGAPIVDDPSGAAGTRLCHVSPSLRTGGRPHARRPLRRARGRDTGSHCDRTPPA